MVQRDSLCQSREKYIRLFLPESGTRERRKNLSTTGIEFIARTLGMQIPYRDHSDQVQYPICASAAGNYGKGLDIRVPERIWICIFNLSCYMKRRGNHSLIQRFTENLNQVNPEQ